MRGFDPSRLHFEFPVPNKEQKFRQLVIYIAHQCLNDPTFSKVKLLKILFFSDFEAYGRYRVPITGMPYRKLPFGPVPVAYKRMEEEMIRERLIRIASTKVYDQWRQRILPLKDPMPEIFSGSDIAIVDNWIRAFWGKSAKAVSEYSHSKAPWKFADESELIPYEAVFVSDEPITYEEAEHVKELATRYGWKL